MTRNIDLNAELKLTTGTFRIAEIEGSLWKLRNVHTGEYVIHHAADLPGLYLEPPTRKEPEPREIESITDKERKRLLDLAAHIDEMVTGKPRNTIAGPNPDYDPATTTLNTRVERKAKELKAIDPTTQVSRATLMRKRKAYEEYGLAGLMDGRSQRIEGPLDRADHRVIEAMTAVIAREVNQSTGTTTRLRERVKKELLDLYPGQNVELPKKTTLYRYFKVLDKGLHTTGNAKLRRTANLSPKRQFGTVRKLRPGEEVQMDATQLDIFVRRDNGAVERPWMTIAVDVATRNILGFSLRFTSMKSVDHTFLLAQMLTPRQLRPGHREAWENARAKHPWLDLVSADERDELDSSRPFIYPETIMIDNGSDFRGSVFESACRKYGISLMFASPHTPTDKAIVERTFGSLKTLLVQHLPGYSGGSPENAGQDPASGDLLDLPTLSEIIDEFIVRIWQNRQHSGLRDPQSPSVLMTPREMYAATFDLYGQRPLPITTEEYISLLPQGAATITREGIRHNNRHYDSPELVPLRNKPSNRKTSNLTGKTNTWEYRYNPYDPRILWVLGPDDQWIECLWRNEQVNTLPYASSIFSAAHRMLTNREPTYDNESAAEQISEILAKARTDRIREARELDRSAAAIDELARGGQLVPTLEHRPDQAPEYEPATTWDDTDDDALPEFEDDEEN